MVTFGGACRGAPPPSSPRRTIAVVGSGRRGSPAPRHPPNVTITAAWVRIVLVLGWSLVCGLWSVVSVEAARLPSLFRGVVVADSPLGVRVVSVEESSQAHLADLRPEDIIVRVEDTEVHSIDEFATLSSALAGRTLSAEILVFRNGAPRELTLHLYSHPILREWGLSFVPDHDVRFAESSIGLAYWTKLGRGFEEAGKPERALEAYLNGLHNIPNDPAAALKVSELLARVSRQRLADGRLEEGLARLRQSLQILERLFDYSLTEEQLVAVRRQLQETLEALRQATEAKQTRASPELVVP